MRTQALLLAVLGATAFAAEPRVSQVLSSRQARLGEPIELTVTVRHPPGEQWALQLPEDLGPVSLLGEERQSRREGDEVVDVITARFGVFALGQQLLPELSLREQATGESRPLERDTQVEIVSSLAPDAPRELRDVAPPRPLFEVDPRKVAAAVLTGLALLGLAVMAVRAGRGLWARLHPPETEEQRDRRLLATLDDLDDEAFFETLDGVVRRGLARWHGVNALERTSEEILRSLRAKPPPGVRVDQLAQTLQDTLLVRFAHRPTSAERRRAALEAAQSVYPAPQKKGAPDAQPALS